MHGARLRAKYTCTRRQRPDPVPLLACQVREVANPDPGKMIALLHSEKIEGRITAR